MIPPKRVGHQEAAAPVKGRTAGGSSVATNVEIRGIDDFRTSPFIGCGILGPNASDLSAEAALTIEMGADAPDIGLTIHPHPTLSETIGMAAEAFEARSPT